MKLNGRIYNINYITALSVHDEVRESNEVGDEVVCKKGQRSEGEVT